jgi:hypothetical protein
MRVSKVTYGFTKNVGNFQSMRVDATVELREGDSFDDALDLASAVVDDALGDKLNEEDAKRLRTERMRAQLAIETK